ncbi:MAG: hypothetical protein JEZ07_01810 [Phycisphaerae bacterium]|nr:hypothetical protein [Phycisphaerae bacterium]
MKKIITVFIAIITFVLISWFFDSKTTGKLIDDTQKPPKPLKIAIAKSIEFYQPKMILLGNSMLQNGIDENLFNQCVGIKTLKITLGGSASAWWYLTMKNVIAKAHRKPDMVVLFFRDDFLIRPEFRVDGSYLGYINDMRDPGGESLLDRLAYLNNLNQLQYLLIKHSSVAQMHYQAKPAINDLIKAKIVGPMTGNQPKAIEKAIARVFENKKLNQNLLTNRQLASEMTKNDSERQFSQKLNNSFLPEIVSIAGDSNIRLILVRVKCRRDLTPGQQPEHLLHYIDQLKKYCQSKNVDLIDFSDDDRIRSEHYADGDHLNPAGCRLFTKMVADKIRTLTGNKKVL